jgi:hypothetical protein
MLKRSLLATALLSAGAFLRHAGCSGIDAPAIYTTALLRMSRKQRAGHRATLPSLGPALKGNPFIVNGSPAAIKQVIRKGRSGRSASTTTPTRTCRHSAGAVPDADALVAYLKGGLQTVTIARTNRTNREEHEMRVIWKRICAAALGLAGILLLIPMDSQAMPSFARRPG